MHDMSDQTIIIFFHSRFDISMSNVSTLGRRAGWRFCLCTVERHQRRPALARQVGPYGPKRSEHKRGPA